MQLFRYTMSHRLTEILPKDWSKLSNLYKFYGTKRYTAYNTIDNYAKWLKKDPQLKHVKFYCLNGDFSDGTFVVTVSNHQFTFINSLTIIHEICLFRIDVMLTQTR